MYKDDPSTFFERFIIARGKSQKTKSSKKFKKFLSDKKLKDFDLNGFENIDEPLFLKRSGASLLAYKYIEHGENWIDYDILIEWDGIKFPISMCLEYYSEFNLSYGSLTILSRTSISGGDIDCKGNSLLIEEYPRLSFDCFFNINNQKKFLNNFIPSKKLSKDSFNLNIQGSLNLLNKKINFDKINIDNNYVAKEEDIVFFKETFERILFNESFFNIFNMDKIKEFLTEVI